MRKSEKVTIADAGRDLGKTFIVTEMDAWAALKWCTRAMLALSQSGTNVPAGTLKKAVKGGPEKLAALGLQVFALIPEATALPLMDEIKLCVTFQPPDGRMSAQPIYDGDLCQIDEPRTWWTLLTRAFSLHLGFLQAAPNQTTE